MLIGRKSSLESVLKYFIYDPTLKARIVFDKHFSCYQAHNNGGRLVWSNLRSLEFKIQHFAGNKISHNVRKRTFWRFAQRRLKSACASTQSNPNIHRQHEKTLHHWLFKMRPVRNLITLRKHAYSNILKISPPKTASFQINSDLFIFLLKT